MNMGGNQAVAQFGDGEIPEPGGIYPSHFGLIFDDRDDWQGLVDRVRRQGLAFYREPMVRYPGQVLAHDTFFLCDSLGQPAGVQVLPPSIDDLRQQGHCIGW
jgi:extradiol dioxygenase family protein